MNTETIARTEDAPAYAAGACKVSWENAIIAQALEILASRLPKTLGDISSPEDLRNFVRLRIGGLPHETFGVILLNAQHGILHVEEMFRGSLSQTSVYPREVAKIALQYNAAAVIFYHNHPSGGVRPSNADEKLTRALKSALDLVDVRTLDHIIVSATGSSSFAEQGLL